MLEYAVVHPAAIPAKELETVRNISQIPIPHNPRFLPALLRLGLVLALAAAGCQARDRGAAPQAKGEPPAAAPPAAAPPAAAVPGQGARPAAAGTGPAAATAPRGVRADGCAVVVDLSGAAAFERIAGQLTQGRAVPDAEFVRLVEQPAYQSLLLSSGGQLFNAGILRNVMQHVYGGEQAGPAGATKRGGRERAGARIPKRRDLLDSFGYARDHAEAVAARLAGFPREGACEVRRLIEAWVPPSQLPDTLVIAFLNAGPDVRWYSQRLLVDAGLAAAAEPAQLPRLLAAQLYRGLRAIPTPPAQAAPGRPTLLATFATLQLEAATAWIEGYPEVRFDAAHPLLGRPDQARRQAAKKAEVALTRLNDMLKPLLTDRALLASKSAVIDDLLRGNAAYAPTGYMMAALIVVRLGERRLHEALTGSPVEFLRAYQDAARRGASGQVPAALANGVPAPSADDLARLPAFADAQFDNLVDLLASPAPR